MAQGQVERRPRGAWTWRWAPLAGLIVVATLLVLATAAAPRLGKRGGELFGRLIRVVQRHPGITAAVVLGSAAGAWLAIGVGVAVQSRQPEERQPGTTGTSSRPAGPPAPPAAGGPNRNAAV